MSRYTFLDLPCPDELAARIADRMVLRDHRYGALVLRLRTEQLLAVPPARIPLRRAA